MIGLCRFSRIVGSVIGLVGATHATGRFQSHGAVGKIVQKASVSVRLKAQRRTCSRNLENRQGRIRDRSRNTLQVLRLINDPDAIDLLDDIGGTSGSALVTESGSC